MSGAVPPLPQYSVMAWCSVKAQGQLYLLPLRFPWHAIHTELHEGSGNVYNNIRRGLTEERTECSSLMAFLRGS
jgi:hypothetical protein